MSAEYPTIITTQCFEVVSRKSTYLSADIDNSNTTIPVDSTAGIPAKGFITIDNETIYYASTDATNFLSVSRGFSGTAVAHTTDTQVKLTIAAETINRLTQEVIATQTYVGISGDTKTTTITGKFNNYLLSGSTAADSSKLINISGTTIAENNIEFTPTAFNLDNDNPASLIEINGTSVAPKFYKVEFGNTDEADLPIFKMPRSYNGGTVTWDIVYCSSTASSVFDIGIRSAQAGSGNSYNPSYGSAVYFGNITCSASTGILGYTSKDIAGASLGLTTNKLNYIRILGGTTCTVQLINSGLRWSKG